MESYHPRHLGLGLAQAKIEESNARKANVVAAQEARKYGVVGEAQSKLSSQERGNSDQRNSNPEQKRSSPERDSRSEDPQKSPVEQAKIDPRVVPEVLEQVTRPRRDLSKGAKRGIRNGALDFTVQCRNRR